MKRLSGYDAQFYFDELAGEYQHTIKLLFFRGEADVSLGFEEVKYQVKAIVQNTPSLRWIVKRVPLDLYHPVWLDGGDVDIDWHVKRAAIAAPGGKDELCEMISQIASTSLEPGLPLWELWLLEGYASGELVCMLKIHHAIADGGEAVRAMENGLLSADQQLRTDTLHVQVPGPQAEPIPSAGSLVVHALKDVFLDTIRGLPRLVAAAIEARRRHRARKKIYQQKVDPLKAPKSPFCGPMSKRRVFYFSSVPIATANQIRQCLGGSINDIILASVAGGVRRYLLAKKMLPTDPHLGAIIGTTRRKEELGQLGNKVTARYIWLPTHIADPQQRWDYAYLQNAVAKEDMALQQGANFEDWVMLFPPVLLKLMSAILHLIAPKSMVGGVAVSNVKGPGEKLYAGDFELSNIVSCGHIKYAAVLNITVWSYVDKLNFALYTSPSKDVDLKQIAQCIEEEYAALLEFTGKKATSDLPLASASA